MNVKARWPCSFSMMTLVPITSAGIRSGVNWMRLNLRFSAEASVRIRAVLPSPGTPSSNACPPTKRQVSTPSMISSCPTMALLTSAFTPR